MNHESKRAATVLRAKADHQSPPELSEAYTSVSAAAAMAWDELLGDTHFADFYRHPDWSREWTTAEHVIQLYKQHLSDNSPRMGAEVVDDVSKLLGFEGLFRWEHVSVSLPVKSSPPTIG